MSFKETVNGAGGQLIKYDVPAAEAEGTLVALATGQQPFQTTVFNGIVLKDELDPLTSRMVHAIIPVAHETKAVRVGNKPEPRVSFSQLPRQVERAIRTLIITDNNFKVREALAADAGNAFAKMLPSIVVGRQCWRAGCSWQIRQQASA